jgi:hypothetical protein
MMLAPPPETRTIRTEPAQLAQQILVRHRATGHLRFALPAALCLSAAADQIVAALRARAGVYRVTLYVGDGKLSVFYDEHVCTVHDVARALFSSLKPVASEVASEGQTTLSLAISPAVQGPSPTLSGGIQKLEARARRQVEVLMQAMSRVPPLRGLQTRVQPVLESALTEKAVTNFLNDLLAFYLIRVHWDLITQHWLREPLKFRNAWLTVFYLVFLLVRYRKAVAKK